MATPSLLDWFRRLLARRSKHLSDAAAIAGLSKRQRERMLAGIDEDSDYIKTRHLAIEHWITDLDMSERDRTEFIMLYAQAHVPEARAELMRIAYRLCRSEAKVHELKRLIDAIIDGMEDTPPTTRRP